MIRAPAAATVVFLYRHSTHAVRNLIRKIIGKIDGGECKSLLLRKIMKECHDVEIGMHSYGGCFRPGQFDRFTTIGRYCSIARTVFAFNRNHPLQWKSTHAYFFNPKLGYVEEDPLEFSPLEIGNDVWIAHGVIILPSVRKIGDGAVIGAGAVVHSDVPAYGIAVGIPARVIKYRFSRETIAELMCER